MCETLLVISYHRFKNCLTRPNVGSVGVGDQLYISDIQAEEMCGQVNISEEKEVDVTSHVTVTKLQ